MHWLARRPLTVFERCLLYVFFFLVLPVLGGIVELRSAFFLRRMGDLDCYLRAAWAVRTGNDLYAVKSDNGWHYNYPPLCAILMTPLADPPRGEDTSGYVPYWASVAICFLFNVLCLFAAAHFLASAFEQASGDRDMQSQPRFCLRWWAVRALPVVVCLSPIGHTMMRGQVNLVILAILCAAMAAWMRGQSVRAGLWLALAISIKVIPVYLLVYPLWKRDLRALAGCGAGLIAGLILAPVAVFGPSQTATHYETYGRVFFGPFLALSKDGTRNDEILGSVNATESVGVRNALHNWMYPSPASRPAGLHVGAKVAYVLLGLAMTLLTLWPRAESSMGKAHQIACLIVLMMMFSPVSHSHYLLFCFPVVMSLAVHTWQHQSTVKLPALLTTILVVFPVTMAIAYLPGMEVLKDKCASLFALLPLWALPVRWMWQGADTQIAAIPEAIRRAA